MRSSAGVFRYTISFPLATASLFLILCSANPQKAKLGDPELDRSDDDYAELAKAPLKEAMRPNPFEGDSRAKAAGHKLFEQHCGQCHGSDAQGSNKAPSLRADEVQHAKSGTLFWLLTNGVVRRGMPVWSKLPEPQRWQIVTYIRSLQTAPSQTGNTHAAASRP